MNGILRAIRDGILTAPDGTKYRLVRGRSLAHPLNPAVIAFPENFEPVVLDLPYDDPEVADPGHLEDFVSEETAELQASLDEANEAANGYATQLASIAELLADCGLAPAEADRGPGWVLAALRDVLLVSRETSREPGPAPDHIPPPRPAARKPRKPLGGE